MVNYIIKSAEYITVSILSDNKLVCHRKIDRLHEIGYLMKDIHIDKITFLLQGTLVEELPEDSFTLSSFYTNDKSVYFVIAERDIIYLTDICKSLGIKDMSVVSYLDFISFKFRTFDKVIVVDNYLDGYAVMYLENSVVKDFMKSSKDRLIETISVMKSMRDVPVRNAKDNLRMNNLDDNLDVILMSKLFNMDRIQNGVFHSLEHLAFILTKSFRNLLKEGKVEDIESMFAELSPTDKPEVSKSSTKAKKSKKSKKSKKDKKTRDYLFETESLIMTTKDRIFNIGLVILIVLNLVGLGINYVYKGMNLDTQSSISTSELRVNSIGDVNSIIEGSYTASPIGKLSELYSKSSVLKIAASGYDYGELYIVILSDSEDSLNSQKDVISKYYTITGSAFMGNYVISGNTYEKTKIIIKAIDGKN